MPVCRGNPGGTLLDESLVDVDVQSGQQLRDFVLISSHIYHRFQRFLLIKASLHHVRRSSLTEKYQNICRATSALPITPAIDFTRTSSCKIHSRSNERDRFHRISYE
ncbi:Uncharacterized protein DAT39_014408 [Clarias magur]|uniref:Uncharacterized protein n=1 Tax=Clarias magur TaxID=1594786 RepID=A0A8J4TEK3_CLAMG|nr:Uncharacterized protein DAT39_014408 [Clarias magur]